MTCWILDTDCLTLFQNGEPRICDRVSSMSFDQIATTIVTAEEQIRGRLNQVRRAQTTRNVSRAYSLLQESLLLFQEMEVLAFTPEAEAIYWQLKVQKVSIGSRDLRIASIALSLDATVVTRNLKDFRQVPDLKFEDWSV